MGYSVGGERPSVSYGSEFIFPFSSPGVHVPEDFQVVLSTVFLMSISTVPVEARGPFIVYPMVF